MQSNGRTCWITAGNMPLKAASVVDLTNDSAIVRLDEPASLPEMCDLYFTYNCTVGRKCRVQFQRGNMATLLFIERIGAAHAARNDNIIQV